MATPSSFKAHLQRRIDLMQELIDGLNGKPFRWGSGAAMSKAPLLKQFGITLVTKTQIKKRGYELRRGMNPVGSCYFGAPIKRDADVYVLECQCVPVSGAE